MGIPRFLHPVTNPTGYATVAGAIYAAAVVIYNAHFHHGVISTPVIIAAVGAVGALLTRQVVTPVADPVDGAGRKLIPLPDTAPVPPGPVPVARMSGGDLPAPPSLGVAGPGVSGTVHLLPGPGTSGPAS